MFGIVYIFIRNNEKEVLYLESSPNIEVARGEISSMLRNSENMGFLSSEFADLKSSIDKIEFTKIDLQHPVYYDWAGPMGDPIECVCIVLTENTPVPAVANKFVCGLFLNGGVYLSEINGSSDKEILDNWIAHYKSGGTGVKQKYVVGIVSALKSIRCFRSLENRSGVEFGMGPDEFVSFRLPIS